MNPNLIQGAPGITMIRERLVIWLATVIMAMGLVLKKELGKGEMQGEGGFGIPGLSIVCSHLLQHLNLEDTICHQLGRLLLQIFRETLLKEMRIRYLFVSCYISLAFCFL
uniref:Uncharacterized protein n=1 Tax=Rhizophora mucronata TaxID=61149 RepID=A0A2P2QSP5_RHIMU